jgi:hypothetical protein
MPAARTSSLRVHVVGRMTDLEGQEVDAVLLVGSADDVAKAGCLLYKNVRLVRSKARPPEKGIDPGEGE